MIIAAKILDAESSEEAEVEAEAVTTVGPDSGTKMEMWSFVEMHNTFMQRCWNNGISRTQTDRFK